MESRQRRQRHRESTHRPVHHGCRPLLVDPDQYQGLFAIVALQFRHTYGRLFIWWMDPCGIKRGLSGHRYADARDGTRHRSGHSQHLFGRHSYRQHIGPMAWKTCHALPAVLGQQRRCATYRRQNTPLGHQCQVVVELYHQRCSRRCTQRRLLLRQFPADAGHR